MSKQPEAAKHSEPLLCKMGCGFFGSNATGDCCSKCWNLIKPKNDATNETDNTSATKTSSPEVNTSDRNKCESAKAPTAVASLTSNVENVPEAAPESSADSATDAGAVTSPAKKKKKKKASYKSMMAGMLEGTSASRDVEKEKEKLREVTGGGHFSKIDKI